MLVSGRIKNTIYIWVHEFNYCMMLSWRLGAKYRPTNTGEDGSVVTDKGKWYTLSLFFQVLYSQTSEIMTC